MCLVRTTKSVVKATKATTKKTTLRTTHKTTAKKKKTTKSHHVTSAPTSFLDIMPDEKMFKDPFADIKSFGGEKPFADKSLEKFMNSQDKSSQIKIISDKNFAKKASIASDAVRTLSDDADANTTTTTSAPDTTPVIAPSEEATVEKSSNNTMTMKATTYHAAVNIIDYKYSDDMHQMDILKNHFKTILGAIYKDDKDYKQCYIISITDGAKTESKDGIVIDMYLRFFTPGFHLKPLTKVLKSGKIGTHPVAPLFIRAYVAEPKGRVCTPDCKIKCYSYCDAGCCNLHVVQHIELPTESPVDAFIKEDQLKQQQPQPCEGDACSQQAPQQPCQGDACAPQQPPPCQGAMCQPAMPQLMQMPMPMPQIMQAPCQGALCAQQAMPQSPCQGVSCAPQPMPQSPCQGASCTPQTMPQSPCQGTSCAQQPMPAQSPCQGTSCQQKPRKCKGSGCAQQQPAPQQQPQAPPPQQQAPQQQAPCQGAACAQAPMQQMPAMAPMQYMAYPVAAAPPPMYAPQSCAPQCAQLCSPACQRNCCSMPPQMPLTQQMFAQPTACGPLGC